MDRQNSSSSSPSNHSFGGGWFFANSSNAALDICAFASAASSSSNDLALAKVASGITTKVSPVLESTSFNGVPSFCKASRKSSDKLRDIDASALRHSSLSCLQPQESHRRGKISVNWSHRWRAIFINSS